MFCHRHIIRNCTLFQTRVAGGRARAAKDLSLPDFTGGVALIAALVCLLRLLRGGNAKLNGALMLLSSLCSLYALNSA